MRAFLLLLGLLAAFPPVGGEPLAAAEASRANVWRANVWSANVWSAEARPAEARPAEKARGGEALLVAESGYGGGALGPAPGAGARLLARELDRLGFATRVETDLDAAALRRALSGFAGRIRPGAPALLFFSGYAVTARGAVVLVPLGARIWTEADARAQGVTLDEALAAMDKAGAAQKIVILDASRRNPFERRFRSFSAGLTGFDPPPGTLLLSAAGDGEIVADAAPGDGPAGLFVSELVKELRAPDSSLDDAFARTRLGVARASGGRETPAFRSTLDAPLFLSAAQMGPLASPIVHEDNPATLDAGRFGPPEGLRPGVAFRDCADCPSLVIAPAGEFLMGSEEFAAERPVHAVRIARPFAIGRFETTLGQWAACVADGGCGGRRLGDGPKDAPAAGLSRTDAEAYLAWLSKKAGARYRLPSEAEWEYAARAGSTTKFWWGDEPGTGQANCRGCGGPGRPTVVGAFPANPFGLYDVAGNVAEWVADCWRDSYAAAPADGAPALVRGCRLGVARGGAFDAGPRFVRSASRLPADQELRYYANGFRVARDLY
ncbi:SUMF1/EgtB/PvdO family nonheme iron enzyme [Methylocella sp.]|uniref:SUMF1/EgtB/PvdO family nonheme iron enzyme n=1 Tax=Methylocella sp. TaxID=1978226 RepID=UPI00378485BF